MNQHDKTTSQPIEDYTDIAYVGGNRRWMRAEKVEIVERMPARRGPNKFWTDAKVRELKSVLETTNCSSARAAEVVGAKNRNAVIGAVNRYGERYDIHLNDVPFAPIKRQPARPRGPDRKPGNTTRQLNAVLRQRADRAAQVAPKPLPVEPGELTAYNDAIPAAQRKTLGDLENHHCHWPVDDFYCGAPGADTVHRRPYCEFHTRVAYSSYGTGSRGLTGHSARTGTWR